MRVVRTARYHSIVSAPLVTQNHRALILVLLDVIQLRFLVRTN